MSEKQKTARDLMERMMGPQFADAIEAAAESGGFGSATAKLAIDYAFADVWARPGLALRERSMIVIAVLVAQGHEAELKNHIRFGLNNGLAPSEIEETLIQTLPYVGFPAVSSAMRVVADVMREKGLDAGFKTAQDRGLFSPPA